MIGKDSQLCSHYRPRDRVIYRNTSHVLIRILLKFAGQGFTEHLMPTTSEEMIYGFSDMPYINWLLLSEGVVRRCSSKKLSLKISQNAQGKTRVTVSLTIFKKRDPGAVVFLWILQKFYRTFMNLFCMKNSSQETFISVIWKAKKD